MGFQAAWTILKGGLNVILNGVKNLGTPAILPVCQNILTRGEAMSEPAETLRAAQGDWA